MVTEKQIEAYREYVKENIENSMSPTWTQVREIEQLFNSHADDVDNVVQDYCETNYCIVRCVLAEYLRSAVLKQNMLMPLGKDPGDSAEEYAEDSPI